MTTIAAVATPPGRGGIGVVRVSGPRSAAIAEAILGRLPTPRYALFGPFRASDGAPIDHGIALYFKAPYSYTGEDTLELQGHGGPVVMDQLLSRTLALGAQLARPGEFTERAYLNGKLDLAQAEAVADLIASTSAAAARAAMDSLQGAFSRRIHALVEGLIALRTYVEAAIDFPEEEIDFLADERIGQQLAALRQQLAALRREAEQGQLLRDGMRLVIVGSPNAGKSSLLNQLAGRDSAIVTELPGTTRDLLHEAIDLDGMPLYITDTAGLRESDDLIEREGVRRARDQAARADRLLLVVDHRCAENEEQRRLRQELPSDIPITTIYNKIDLTGEASGERLTAQGEAIFLSAKSGAGLAALRQHLKAAMGYRGGETGFMARRRHLFALDRAQQALEAAQYQLGAGAGELAAEELRQAQQALGEITGEFTSDDLLGRIFASFCIGK